MERPPQMRASERQRTSGYQRPAWPGNALNDISIDLGQLVPADLPHGREAVEAGRELARGVERVRSLYCEDKGVGSEREWRERARERRIPCSTMNVGLNTWADTRVALENIYESCMSRG